jgi:colanic acid biosynthesis glycosyl transferase WcaI
MSETHIEQRLRIGYLAQHFLPEIGALPARASEMALRWKERGAEVTMLTAMPHRPQGVIPPEYRGKRFLEEDWRGIRVLRSWVYATPKSGFARTVLNNASFMASGALHGMTRGRSLDVLIATSPPYFVHAAGEFLRRWLRVPLVLEIRDLWPDYLVEMGVVRNTRLQRALFASEAFLLRRAARVVVISEAFKERIHRKGVPRERIEVIPNGVDTDFYFAAEEDAPLPELRRRDGEFIVGYLGNFGAGQELRTVLDAARILADQPRRLRFVLAGDGPEKERVLAHAVEHGLRNVSIHPSLPKDRTRAFYNACDVCLVPLAPLQVFQETIPSKIFEIMACERPVLASLSGEGARIVEASGGGIATAPGDASGLAAGLAALLGMTEAQRRELGSRGRDYVARTFDRRLLADRYLDLLARVAGREVPDLSPEHTSGDRVRPLSAAAG